MHDTRTKKINGLLATPLSREISLSVMHLTLTRQKKRESGANKHSNNYSLFFLLNLFIWCMQNPQLENCQCNQQAGLSKEYVLKALDGLKVHIV